MFEKCKGGSFEWYRTSTKAFTIVLCADSSSPRLGSSGAGLTVGRPIMPDKAVLGHVSVRSIRW